MKKLGKKYGGNDFLTDEIKSLVLQLSSEGLSYRKIKEQVPSVSLGSISNIVRGNC